MADTTSTATACPRTAITATGCVTIRRSVVATIHAHTGITIRRRWYPTEVTTTTNRGILICTSVPIMGTIAATTMGITTVAVTDTRVEFAWRATQNGAEGNFSFRPIFLFRSHRCSQPADVTF